MSPYQRCPYCETVIEINSDDKERLKRHIRIEHPEDERAEQYHAA